ncbi:MAG: MBL fold metallo-hydrolase, partial [Armatimonadetes bacterium]|nr:MBL fold metallo-hydrolase [Armatimonadota bacterium]
EPPHHAHTVVTEATYGDRLHPPIASSIEALAQALQDIVQRRGVAMMPIFAVGRTETILYELGQLLRAGRIPTVPVYLDSPLALEATAVLRRHLEYYDEEARALLQQGIDPLAFPSLHLVRTPEEPRQLNDLAGPALILAGSGMCTGGRIRHHLRNRLPNPRDMVIFVGYQAHGTLGRLLADGVGEVKLYGEEVPVRAEIRSIEGFSAHADQNGLLEWLKAIKGVERVVINHAEPTAAAAYAEVVEQAGLPRPLVASFGQTVEL